jgi:hypothetical protein
MEIEINSARKLKKVAITYEDGTTEDLNCAVVCWDNDGLFYMDYLRPTIPLMIATAQASREVANQIEMTMFGMTMPREEEE